MSGQPQYNSIITAREIEVVRNYIRLSTRLRDDYDRMKKSSAFTALSKQCGFNTELDEQGVKELIYAVLEHAGRWADIEVKMRTLCDEVFQCSDCFTASSDAVLKKIRSLPGYEDSSAQLRALPEDAWEGISFDEVGFTIVPSIKSAIDQMSKELGCLEVTGGDLRDAVLDFKIELMNTIQTALRKITQLDTVQELEETLLRVDMSEDDRLIVRGHMENVTSAFSEIVAHSYTQDNKVINVEFINYYKDDYEKILKGLPSTSAETVKTLVLKMRSGAVLTQHFSGFHDAVECLGVPLEFADKGIGQLRTLWTVTLDIMQSAKDRIHQVTSFAQIKRIEKSLASAKEQWLSARSNAEELDRLLAVSY